MAPDRSVATEGALWSATPGMATLTIVEGQVDHFVDDVLHHLPFIEQSDGMTEKLVCTRLPMERMGFDEED